MLPVAADVAADNRFEFGARGEVGFLQRGFGDAAVAEVAQAVRHAAHEQAFQLQRLVAGADDALGRAAADVDDQAFVARRRQAVRDAEVNQPRFFTPGDHFNRESQRGAGAAQELLAVLGDTQRVGADGAHAVRVKAAQSLAEAGETGQRAFLRFIVKLFVLAEARAEAHRFAQ